MVFEMEKPTLPMGAIDFGHGSSSPSTEEVEQLQQELEGLTKAFGMLQQDMKKTRCEMKEENVRSTLISCLMLSGYVFMTKELWEAGACLAMILVLFGLFERETFIVVVCRALMQCLPNKADHEQVVEDFNICLPSVTKEVPTQGKAPIQSAAASSKGNQISHQIPRSKTVNVATLGRVNLPPLPPKPESCRNMKRGSMFSEPEMTEASPSEVDGVLIKTDEELAAVMELRVRLEDVRDQATSALFNLSNKCLIRFVTARNLDLDLAESMFREALKWRQEKKPEEIYNRIETEGLDEIVPLHKYLTASHCGYAKNGAPLIVDRIGQLDVPGLVEHFPFEQLELYHIWKQEKNAKLFAEGERRSGRPHNKLVVITDLTGLGRKHLNKAAFAMFKKLVFIDDHYYPEQLEVSFLIGAPMIFSAIWAIVKNFFDPNTRAKINIHRGIPTKEILKYVDAKDLPKFLGGELEVDGDPYCTSIISPGGEIIPEN